MRPITWAFTITSYSLDVPECAGNTLGVFIVPPAITSDGNLWWSWATLQYMDLGEVEPQGPS